MMTCSEDAAWASKDVARANKAWNVKRMMESGKSGTESRTCGVSRSRALTTQQPTDVPMRSILRPSNQSLAGPPV